MTRFAALALTLSVATTSHAGGYGYNYVKSYAQPLQIVVYQVGAGVRSAAEIEAYKRADPVYQLGLKLLEINPQALEHLAAEPQALSQQTPVPSPTEPPLQVVQSCKRCHSGAEPKGGVAIDGETKLTASQVKAIKAQLLAKKMPPASAPEAKGFEAGQAGAVVAEAIDLLEELAK